MYAEVIGPSQASFLDAIHFVSGFGLGALLCLEVEGQWDCSSASRLD